MTKSKSKDSKQLKSPFKEWFDKVKQSVPVLSGDREDESLSNHWSFSLTEKNRKKIKISDLVTFINVIMSFWKTRVKEIKRDVPYRFYSWYDEMADSLNFSLVTGTINEPLPFQCKVKLIGSIEPIGSKFLDGKEYIPFDDILEIEWEDPDTEVNDKALIVYVCHL